MRILTFLVALCFLPQTQQHNSQIEAFLSSTSGSSVKKLNNGTTATTTATSLSIAITSKTNNSTGSLSRTGPTGGDAGSKDKAFGREMGKAALNNCNSVVASHSSVSLAQDSKDTGGENGNTKRGSQKEQVLFSQNSSVVTPGTTPAPATAANAPQPNGQTAAEVAVSKRGRKSKITSGGTPRPLISLACRY